jgi:hypothetical protein
MKLNVTDFKNIYQLENPTTKIIARKSTKKNTKKYELNILERTMKALNKRS